MLRYSKIVTYRYSLYIFGTRNVNVVQFNYRHWLRFNHMGTHSRDQVQTQFSETIRYTTTKIWLVVIFNRPLTVKSIYYYLIFCWILFVNGWKKKLNLTCLVYILNYLQIFNVIIFYGCQLWHILFLSLASNNLMSTIRRGIRILLWRWRFLF